MNMIKGCLFDLDGVIVDTAKYHFLAWKRLAEELGFEFSRENNERLKGVSRMTSLNILLDIGGIQVDEATKLEMADKKNNWYVAYIKEIDKTEVLPGVEEYIKKLKKKGIKLGIGSASKNTMTILENIGMIEYFDVIIDGTKVSNAKPDPEVFLLGARQLNLMPKECVVFEDAEAGIEAARNAGMHSIGIGKPEILKHADKVIPGFENLEEDILEF
jgi:beta-phosphoglucomutase